MVPTDGDHNVTDLHEENIVGRHLDALAAAPKKLTAEQERAERRSSLLTLADDNLSSLDDLLNETTALRQGWGGPFNGDDYGPAA